MKLKLIALLLLGSTFVLGACESPQPELEEPGTELESPVEEPEATEEAEPEVGE